MKKTRCFGTEWPALRLAGAVMAGALFLAGCATAPPHDSQSSRVQLKSETTAKAPPPLIPEAPLTVDQAVERAQKLNARVLAARAALRIAEQQRRAATDIKDPEFEYHRAWTSKTLIDNTGTGTDDGQYSVFQANVFVPNPWLLVPRVNARQADLRAARADVRDAVWQVGCETRRLFAEIRFLNSDLESASKIAGLYGDILKAARSRAEQGAVTSADLVSAIRRELQVEDEAASARQRLVSARNELAALLDMPPESLRIDANASPAIVAAQKLAVSPAQAESTALQRRGDIEALHWRSSAADSAYREARNVRLPWIKEIKGMYRTGSYDDDGFVTTRQDQSSVWRIGFAMDVPIFSWTKNHAADVSLAKSEQAGANETAGLQQARREVDDAITVIEASWRQLERYNREVAPLMTEMRRALGTLQSASGAMPDQIAVMELQIVETERLELAARHRYELAALALERSMGEALFETAKTPN